MKKTKLLFIMLLAGCLVACGNNNSSSNESDTSSPSSVESSTPSSSSTDSNSSSADPIPSGEVTNDEWKDALSEAAFTNFTASIEYEGETYELIVDLDKGVYYFNDNSGSEYYYSNENDNYYIYAKKSNESEYTRRETTQENFSEQLLAIEAMAVLMFNDCYTNAEYNADTNSYVAENVVIGDYSYGIEFKFENGNLVYADIDLGEDSHLIINYTNYGSTDVTLPSNFVDGENNGKDEKHEVTENEWKNALSHNNLNNVTIDFVYGDVYSGIAKSAIDCDGAVYGYLIDEESSEIYCYSREDNKYYEYYGENEDSEFEKSEIDWIEYDLEMLWNLIPELIPESMDLFLDNYSEFTFDSETKMYTCDEFVVDGRRSNLFDIKLKFSNNQLVYLEMQFDEDATSILTASFSNYGSTEVTLPSSFVDSDDSLVGKTFVFVKTECVVWDENRIAMSNASNAGSTITFETETKATALVMNGSVVQKFNYTIDGNEISMTIYEMTVDGVEQDISYIPVTTFVLNGDELVSVQRADAENFVYMTYILVTK